MLGRVPTDSAGGEAPFAGNQDSSTGTSRQFRNQGSRDGSDRWEADC